MKSMFERMGGAYRQEGDYLLPNLLPPESPDYQIRKYGHLRKTYLKEHRSSLYATMLLNESIYHHLAEIDQACNERMELIVRQMAERENVNEDLKASAQLEWVGRMNNIRSRAEEIVLSELVYV